MLVHAIALGRRETGKDMPLVHALNASKVHGWLECFQLPSRPVLVGGWEEGGRGVKQEGGRWVKQEHVVRKLKGPSKSV